MYDFFYKVYYETAKHFIEEEQAKVVAQILCQLTPPVMLLVTVGMVYVFH